ncbi:MAG: segregation ATPase, FtsK/SpoIIIE family [Verrucomicrobiales bacterium]|nr:segregation ATPase, FtsK/SpoIIIE family [Verrucomicrobiales bacterium]
MTANNPSPVADLSVARTTSLIERLSAAITRHAAAEELLVKETRTRRMALERRHGEATAAFDQQVARESGAIDSEWLARWEKTRRHHESRMVRIEKAERNSHRDLPRRIEAARAHWLGGLQRQRLHQERLEASRSEQALQAYAARAPRLAEALAQLETLRRRAFVAFNGSPGFRLLLKPQAPAGTPAEPASAPDPAVPAGPSAWSAADADAALAAVEAAVPVLTEKLRSYRGKPLARFFTILTPPVLLVIIFAGALVLAGSMGFDAESARKSGMIAIGALVGLAVVYLLGMNAARPGAVALAEGIKEQEAVCARLTKEARAANDAEQARLKVEQERIVGDIQSKWGGVDEVDTDFAKAAQDKLKAQVPRIAAKNEAMMDAKRRRMEAAHSADSGANETKFNERRQALEAKQNGELAELAAAESSRWDQLSATWQETVPAIYEELAAIRAAALPLAPAWAQLTADTWTPPETVPTAMPFANLKVDLLAHAGTAPTSPKLALPGPATVDVPLALDFPEQGSLLIQSRSAAQGPAASVLNNIILRLLAASRPGKASFTIIDPVGLGQNFGGLMHLSDYEDSLINHRIWTQRDQIDERLGILSGHIEKVIQMYLRNEFSSITEYNQQAGVVAEKYHYLVIADFPANFSETAVKRLESIVASGPRCGVFTYMHTDLRPVQPDAFTSTGAGPNRIGMRLDGPRWELDGLKMDGAAITPEMPPGHDHALALLHRIGKSSIDAGRVEVPFSQISPAPADYWKGDTTQELRVAIGRTGAVKHQMLAIGKGTRQHALFAGKTGSGKSTLFHVIITNLALTCSPDQVEFYLIDFKKGVEFKCYANKKLPHARVVAIESDREFALSVLHRLDEELKRRGDLFRKLNAQDLAGYQRAGGTEPMPRSLLIIDEFQEFFTEDDPIAQTASLLLDRIVRQGRAFGIHVLLGSQTLGGAYSLARATLGQMTIRVALQCNEADAYLIMDDNNPAPRLLSRPGEGIYNDAAGSVEGNSPFQVVWLPDGERDRLLDEIHDLAVKSDKAQMAPIVFEGNAPADLLGNALMRKILDTPPTSAPGAGRCWLGAPNAIKGPTEAVFHRQSGQHLLVVGQREEASLSMLGLSLLALAAQYPEGTAKFHFFHSATPGTPEEEFVEQLAAAVPGLQLVRPNEAAAAIAVLSAELKERAVDGNPSAPASYVFIHGLHRFKKLRQEDDFSFSMDADSGPNPGAQFNELISEGSSHGIHLLVSLDTFNNVNRSLSRKALTEFEMRVVFQMSVNDSSSLIDSPAASNLGLHRALFYNEHAGTLETFRPYAMPEAEWLEKTARLIASRHPGAAAHV